MPTSAPSRSSASRNTPFRNAISSRRPIILCGAAEEEIDHLGHLIHQCFSETAARNTDLETLQDGVRLFNYASFRTVRELVSVEAAVAVSGPQWLHALELLQSLANHFCSRLCGVGGGELDSNESLAYWKHSVFLAESAELLARCTTYCNPMAAWVCGLLLGAANTAKAVEAAMADSNLRAPFATPLDMAKLLNTIGQESQLALPDARSAPRGPWNVLSGVNQLLASIGSTHWTTQSLRRIEACDWPHDLEPALHRRLKELQNSSHTLATVSWTFAVHQLLR